MSRGCRHLSGGLITSLIAGDGCNIEAHAYYTIRNVRHVTTLVRNVNFVRFYNGYEIQRVYKYSSPLDIPTSHHQPKFIFDVID